MFRSVRIIVVAAIIAASLAIGGSDASAATPAAKCAALKPSCPLTITWE